MPIQLELRILAVFLLLFLGFGGAFCTLGSFTVKHLIPGKFYGDTWAGDDAGSKKSLPCWHCSWLFRNFSAVSSILKQHPVISRPPEDLCSQSHCSHCILSSLGCLWLWIMADPKHAFRLLLASVWLYANPQFMVFISHLYRSQAWIFVFENVLSISSFLLFF